MPKYEHDEFIRDSQGKTKIISIMMQAIELKYIVAQTFVQRESNFNLFA